MAPLAEMLASAHPTKRQKRSTKIPVQNSVPTATSSMPSNALLGTLLVSLPSGRLLDVQTASCSETIKLGDFVHPGENLLNLLDGKGSQLLTLQAFGGTTKARMFARLKLGQTTRPCSFLCEFVVDPTNVANRIATIRVFEIQFATKPEHSCDEFITRHNSNCNLIYFDAASVPYLGVFPSEITGNSLFSVIHADDAAKLQEVHRELRAGVKLARSNGIRFVAHDGRVWRANSEFACFTNPWSDCVEMVVAKHRLVEMVEQVRPGQALLSEEQCRQHDHLIRSILESPPEFTLNEKNEKLTADNLMASGAVSPPLTTKNSEDSPQPQSPDLLLSYNQINCLENVHRLLKSQTNESGQKQDGPSAANNSNQAAPLTRELLHQFDLQCEKNCKGKWQRRLQMKRAVSSNASTTHDVPLKMARTEPTSPSAITAPNTSLFLSLILEQQRRLQQTGQLPMLAASALSNLLTQHATSGTSTPSNL